MHLLPLLIVTVLGSGGPPGLTHREGPPFLPNSTITVRRHGEVVASSDNGRIRLRLRPGVYTLGALLHDEPGVPLPNCETKTIRLWRARRARHVDLYCSIS